MSEESVEKLVDSVNPIHSFDEKFADYNEAKKWKKR